MHDNNNMIGEKRYDAEARYLGPYIHVSNNFDNELVRRSAAMCRIFWIWRKFWPSASPYKFRVLIFRAIIISTLFSCVTAYALNARHYERMQAAVCKLLRRFYAGKLVTRPRTAK
jgi:hypothetical protein